MSGHAIQASAGGLRGRSAELARALAVHLLVLPVYYFWAWVGFGAQELWGSYLVYAFMWLLVAGLMVHWSHRGRVHVVPRVVRLGASVGDGAGGSASALAPHPDAARAAAWRC